MYAKKTDQSDLSVRPRGVQLHEWLWLLFTRRKGNILAITLLSSVNLVCERPADGTREVSLDTLITGSSRSTKCNLCEHGLHIQHASS